MNFWQNKKMKYKNEFVKKKSSTKMYLLEKERKVNLMLYLSQEMVLQDNSFWNSGCYI